MRNDCFKFIIEFVDLYIGFHKFSDKFKNKIYKKYIYIISHFKIGERSKKINISI
jgi:hypothetical protein